MAKSIRVKGLVQGVGFRPAVWGIANKMQLCGQVLNDGQGVEIELFGNEKEIQTFIKNLQKKCPPLARIDSIQQTELNTEKPEGFSIAKSNQTTAQTGIVPDAASCSECIKDSINQDNRRYRYPFTNCTHCGPRLTIIKAIPYDRKNTSMAPFILCKKCQSEYDNPADRRFHAQPNACPECGPKIELQPRPRNTKDDIQATINLLKKGKIIAIKGIGGFHLACDATNQQAVVQLRKAKRRSAKPFALMAANTQIVENYCSINTDEKKLIESNCAPIVLLKQNNCQTLPHEIAPGQNCFGFMLPYSPLLHLLFENLNRPLVMTSGNLSDIPQCIDNDDALEKLKSIADYWLLNNRDIVNRVDDSVVRIANNNTQILRRARGYAPTSIPLPNGFDNKYNVLACGGELKNTFCLIKNGMATLSQHIGDLKNSSTFDDYQKTINLYENLYQHHPQTIAIDAHPDYLSSKYGYQLAQKHKLNLIKIQHHHAHIASVLAENNRRFDQGKVLGIVLDGIGYGDKCSLWGGEFLLADYHSSTRLGRLKPMALIGGSQAMKKPWRNTYANLVDYFDWEEIITNYAELEIIKFLTQMPTKTLDAMLVKRINSPFLLILSDFNYKL